MIEALTELAELSQVHLSAGFLVFLRVGAAMMLLPALGEAMIPARIKLAIAFAFTAVILPLVADAMPEVSGFASTIALGGREVLVGLILGFSLRVLVFALQMAGTIAAQSTSLSQLFGGAAVDPQPALGAILVLGGLALATLLGLHVRIATMFVSTYDTVPFGAGLPPGPIAEWGVAAVAQAFRFAVVLAMPFLLASLLYNLALGFINRAMPQLMVAFVGAPAITWGALCVLALAGPLLLSVWADALSDRLAAPFGFANGR